MGNTSSINKTKYARGKIYSIYNSDTDSLYIGSTIDTLNSRLLHHKSVFKKWKLGKYHYVSSFECFTTNNYKINLEYEYPCDTFKELIKEEGKLIKLFGCCVNKKIPGRTREEYYQDNREEICERVNNYRLENYEKIKLKKKEYYRQNQQRIIDKHSKVIICECGDETTYGHHARHRKTQRHKQMMCPETRRKIEVAEENKIICECGSKIKNTTKMINRHLKRQKHLDYLESNH